MKARSLIESGLTVLCVLGCTDQGRSVQSGTRALTESTSYSSAERQSQLKAALAAAGIAYRTEMREGKEFVVWDAKDAAAAKAAAETSVGPELPAGRHMGASKDLAEEFENWLRANNVSYFKKSRDGREYIVWGEQDDPRVREWLRARLPEAVYAATIGRSAPAASQSK